MTAPNHRRPLPPRWKRAWLPAEKRWEAERIEDLPDGSRLEARAEPGEASDGTGLWSAELQGPAKYQGGGGRKLIGHASGSYRGALVDGAEAAEQAIERGAWLPRLASEGAR